MRIVMPPTLHHLCRSAFLVIAICLSIPAIADDLTFAEQHQKGRKTLLSWNTSEQPDAADEDDRLVTDRPHFSEASSLVGLGVTQIETGYSFFLDK